MSRSKQEYLLEFQRVRNTVKVTAVDPITGTEASIVGPANAGRAYLSRTAVNKLIYVMARNDAKDEVKDEVIKTSPGILT